MSRLRSSSNRGRCFRSPSRDLPRRVRQPGWSAGVCSLGIAEAVPRGDGSGQRLPGDTLHLDGGGPQRAPGVRPVGPPSCCRLSPTCFPASCTISFTFDVLRSGPSPTVHHLATLSGFVVPAFGTVVAGASTTTVHRAPVTISAVATAATVPPGAPMAASVLQPPAVSADAPRPTGTVSFSLYRPADTNCSGAPLHGPVTAEVGNGPVRSPSFASSAAGTTAGRLSTPETRTMPAPAQPAPHTPRSWPLVG